jgi:hypothetical protein
MVQHLTQPGVWLQRSILTRVHAAKACSTKPAAALRAFDAGPLERTEPAGGVAAIHHGLGAVAHAVLTGRGQAAAGGARRAARAAADAARAVVTAFASLPAVAFVVATATAIRGRLVLIANLVVAAGGSTALIRAAYGAQTIAAAHAGRAIRAARTLVTAAVGVGFSAVWHAVLAGWALAALRLLRTIQLGTTVVAARTGAARGAAGRARTATVYVALPGPAYAVVTARLAAALAVAPTRDAIAVFRAATAGRTASRTRTAAIDATLARASRPIAATGHGEVASGSDAVVDRWGDRRHATGQLGRSTTRRRRLPSA